MGGQKKSLWKIVWNGFDQANNMVEFLMSILKRACLVVSVVLLTLFLYQSIANLFISDPRLLNMLLYFIGFIFFLFFPYSSDFYITWKEKRRTIFGKELITRTGDLHVRGVPYTRNVFWLKLEYDLQRILIGFMFTLVGIVLLGALYILIL